MIVAGQLPREPHNAPLHLFAASGEQVRYGADHYRRRADDTSSLIYQLFAGYQREGVPMPYTMEDFRKDFVKEHFKDLAPQEQREALEALR